MVTGLYKTEIKAKSTEHAIATGPSRTGNNSFQAFMPSMSSSRFTRLHMGVSLRKIARCRKSRPHRLLSCLWPG